MLDVKKDTLHVIYEGYGILTIFTFRPIWAVKKVIWGHFERVSRITGLKHVTHRLIRKF